MMASMNTRFLTSGFELCSVAKGEEVPESESALLHFLQRLVSLLHLVDGILKRRRINPFGQFDESDVPVVADPVGEAPLAHRLDGKDDIGVDRSVLREVLIDSADSQLQIRIVLVGDLLADSRSDSTKFLGESL